MTTERIPFSEWPKATGLDKQGGWEIDPTFLHRVRKLIMGREGSDCAPTMEQIEDVLLALDAITPWDDFKRDEPVMVRNVGGEWRPRYFSHVDEHGRPHTFKDGMTAWSVQGQPLVSKTVFWAECRRPTREELEGQAA